MNDHYFRVEAVNLTPTVYDTSDISTMRGGGFYLLHKVHALAKNGHAFNAQIITEGASAVVFKIATDQPDEVRKKILSVLYDPAEPNFIPDMMFLVVYAACDRRLPFGEQMARLQGRIRLEQQQTANLRIFQETLVPARSASGAYLGFDALNRLLPAHHPTTIKGDISTFTHRRRQFGIDLRHDIYRIILEDATFPIDDYRFTDDLEELSDDGSKGNLSGKIAFIYIDGNQFGRLQQSLDEDQLRQFDICLHRFKSEALKRILQLLDPTKARLETLLWGGDEIKIIVPAWLGWCAAQCFFEAAQELNPTAVNARNKICDLTYSMGLVFTYHKNPIRNIGAIAEELTTAAKSYLKTASAGAPYHREQGDRLHYVVLESIESLPAAYSAFAKNYYGAPGASLCLSLKDMQAIAALGGQLKALFPRSRVYNLAAMWSDTANVSSQKRYLECIRDGLSACECSPADKQRLGQDICAVTGAALDRDTIEKDSNRGYRWRQLAELWDYLP